jgi:hypothetical protein
MVAMPGEYALTGAALNAQHVQGATQSRLRLSSSQDLLQLSLWLIA